MSDKSSSSLAAEIRFLTGAISKRVSRAFEQRLTSRYPGVSGLQYGILRLVRLGDRTISEISGKMMLAPATLVPAVDKLEKEGLLIRGKDPQDRRRNPLRLTDTGLKLLSEVSFVSPEDPLCHAIQTIGQEGAQTLDELLQRLLAALSPGDNPIPEALSGLSVERAHSGADSSEH